MLSLARAQVLDMVTETFARMLWETGFVHADPHPGTGHVAWDTMPRGVARTLAHRARDRCVDSPQSDAVGRLSAVAGLVADGYI